LLFGRIPDQYFHHKPIYLRLGQRVGALRLNGILGGHYQERLGNTVALAGDCDLSFLHHLEQRALHLRRSPVNLIGKEEIGEDGTQRRGKVTVFLVIDARSHQVRRHEVRRELNSPERSANSSGERLNGEGLGEPRDAFDEQMTLGQDGYQHTFQEMILANDDLFHLVEAALHEGSNLASACFFVVAIGCARKSLELRLQKPFLSEERDPRHASRLALNGQNGGIPAAAAAFSMGTAKPMPTKKRWSVGFRIPVTMPTTSPSRVTSGPPEFPGLTAASNWMRFVSTRFPSGERNSRRKPDTTPAVTEGPMPNGKPTATTWSPRARSAVDRMVAAKRSSGIVCA